MIKDGFRMETVLFVLQCIKKKSILMRKEEIVDRLTNRTYVRIILLGRLLTDITHIVIFLL